MIGYIYYILDLTNANMYIGSTNNIENRIRQHKQNKFNKCISKQIIDNNNYIFEIFEENEFDTKEDRLKREQFYIDNNDCINNVAAFRSDEYRKQYKYEYNKSDKMREYYKNWTNENKDYISNKKKEYREKNKDKTKDYYEKNKHIFYRKVCCIKCKKELNLHSLKRHIKNKH